MGERNSNLFKWRALPFSKGIWLRKSRNTLIKFINLLFYLFYDLDMSRLGFAHPILCMRGERSNRLLHHGGRSYLSILTYPQVKCICVLAEFFWRIGWKFEKYQAKVTSPLEFKIKVNDECSFFSDRDGSSVPETWPHDRLCVQDTRTYSRCICHTWFFPHREFRGSKGNTTSTEKTTW